MSEALLEKILLESIVASPTNPRKRFDEKDLQDLAASIKEHGVMQPILVRMTAGGSYEIVAGERRWRASKIANQTHIPAIVRDLDDIETLQLQIIENLQRSDLHPLEQADGFRQMLNATSTGDHKPWTVDELAAKVGKSRSYIYESLNLSKLSDYAKDKFLAGKFGRDAALLISRIPGEALQESAIKAIVEREMSFRVTKEFIRRDFTYDLALAKWDKFDDKVLPDKPSCASCPKRTGNYPELYPDIESPDVCTDTECFRAKKTAHAQFCIQTLPKVIHGDEAKAIAPYGVDGYYITNGYTKDINSMWVDGIPISTILQDERPEGFTLIDEYSTMATVFKKDDIEALAKERLQEKLATGELTMPEKKEAEKSEWAIQHEKKEARANQLNPIFRQYFIERLAQLNTLLTAHDRDTEAAFIDYVEDNQFENEATKALIFEAFGHSHISEFTDIELLLALSIGNLYGHIKLDGWSIADNLVDISQSRPFQLTALLESLTGVALPPLPAAQAQELNAESQAEAPGQPEADALSETPAEDPAEAVETSANEDIAPGALPDVLPAETAVDPAPAAQASESNTADAPLSGFEKAKLKGEREAARRQAIKNKKVSGQPDAESGADQVASANHAH